MRAIYYHGTQGFPLLRHIPLADLNTAFICETKYQVSTIWPVIPLKRFIREIYIALTGMFCCSLWSAFRKCSSRGFMVRLDNSLNAREVHWCKRSSGRIVRLLQQMKQRGLTRSSTANAYAKIRNSYEGIWYLLKTFSDQFVHVNMMEWIHWRYPWCVQMIQKKIQFLLSSSCQHERLIEERNCAQKGKVSPLILLICSNSLIAIYLIVVRKNCSLGTRVFDSGHISESTGRDSFWTPSYPSSVFFFLYIGSF